jgi:DNA-binding response OmpR family regulator
MTRLLIVDDEADIRAVIREYAEFEGYTAVEAADGREAVQLTRDQDFDAIIMDAMMPKLDGFSAAKKIHEHKAIPILMLSARGEEYDKLFGFEMGVDDYVVKPFSPKELMARLKVIVTRNAGAAAAASAGANAAASASAVASAAAGASAVAATAAEKDGATSPAQPEAAKPASAPNPGTLELGRLSIDTLGHRVSIDGNRTDLTPKEYDLLLYLAQNSGIALTRGQLLAAVWGYDFYGDDRTVDAQIKLLRARLGSCREYIVTLRGVGYRFEVQV